METFAATWAVVFLIVGLNGFAAGVAVVLHLWGGRQRRGPRILTAATVTGLLPAVIVLPPMLFDKSLEVEGPVAWLGAAVFFVIAFVASLPGAVIVGRKLDGPGYAYRVFE